MDQSALARLSKAAGLRRWIGRPFLSANEWVWGRLPTDIRATRPMRLYGSFLHSLVKLRSSRRQFHGTFFFRNRPELEMIRALADRKPRGAALRICVLACSNGAEVYSILWTIRSVRPDLRVIAQAVDISNEVVEIGEKGVYSSEASDLIGSSIFDRIMEQEIDSMFNRHNGELQIKSWLKEGIEWRVGDAGAPGLLEMLGEQDIVVANKFLCHMRSPEAERCLRNLSRLVRFGGYLVVSGVDLDVRTKVAHELRWLPLQELMEEIHNGDSSVLLDWPWKYWGLEPFDRNKEDWRIRYASVFKVGCSESESTSEINDSSAIEEAV
jgi:SAM-dependent methyltransferase